MLSQRGTMGRSSRQQSGAILLESLIAVLIFSIGILAMMGLQASALKHIGESKYRLDATYLANQLVGTIWSSAGTAGEDISKFNCNPNCSPDDFDDFQPMQQWLQQVAQTLPGVDWSDGGVAPTVVVTKNPYGSCTTETECNQVVITLRWKSQTTPNGAPVEHQYQTTAYVNLNTAT